MKDTEALKPKLAAVISWLCFVASYLGFVFLLNLERSESWSSVEHHTDYHLCYMFLNLKKGLRNPKNNIFARFLKLWSHSG